MESSWIHLYAGLADKKHLRRMGMALWVYVYMLVNANRKTGVVFRKRETVAKDLGISIKTVERYLETLRSGGYITTERKQYSLIIQITNWRSLTDYRGSRKRLESMVSDLSGKMRQP